MSKPIRRVVTGHNAQGKSIFVADGPSPHVMQRGTGSVTVTELWETRASPADNRGNADAIDRPFRLHPPNNGTVFRIIAYPPDRLRLPATIGKQQVPQKPPIVLVGCDPVFSPLSASAYANFSGRCVA